ncbi:hypothetical protein [Levilactobacillus spicheri]|uniref:Uncharacterized protein n=1 Tax=Levilactobacillus spicheri TaxID=216463 RepID=A0A0F3RVE8_9LACO|nr:hypothetical protein [Levilactobacillus spicheri]KJW12879.1 hypothetical protein VC81_06425 [Levilactobacillus spicheri]KJW13574.1 hypothetical protein VC81_03690 [Levilactobacillus spicheri]
MAKWNQLTITDAGYQLSAKTMAGTKIQYTHAQTTDKDMTALTSDELKAITKLDSVVQDLSVGIVTVQDDHTVNVPVRVTNQDVTADYLLYGLAIFAKPADGDEILYGIATAANPDMIAAHNGTTVVGTNFNLKVHVGSAANVNIVISPDGSVSNEELMGMLKDYVLKKDLPDFSTYATKEWVTTQISAIPKPDMSQYSTTGQMTTAISDAIKPLSETANTAASAAAAAQTTADDAGAAAKAASAKADANLEIAEKYAVKDNGDNTITVNGLVYAPIPMDVATKDVSTVPNFVSGIKINGHLFNADPTNGVTIDGKPVYIVEPDEATAKTNSTGDVFHSHVTEES